jgi:hypothetical protein
MGSLRDSSWKVLLVGGALLAGCTGEIDGTPDESVAEDPGFIGTNGLIGINGLTAINGFNGINGFNAVNGLIGVNGLADGVGLMSSPAGRSTVSYLVRCALPAGRSITKKDQFNVSYTYQGQIGVAPQWETGSCDNHCQEHVSACMLAHVNTSGTNVQLWLDGDSPAIGWGKSTNYPYQEGSFFGNIFQSPPRAHYCHGKDFDQGVVPGRLGANQAGAPYTNPGGSNAYCMNQCTAADIPNQGDGYKACSGFNHIVTVWRNFDPNIDYKVCNRNSGKCLDIESASMSDYAKVVQNTYSSAVNQKWRITQVSPGKYNFKNVKSGKLLDVLGGSTSNGAAMIQYAPNGGTNQQWSFTPTGDGYYKFSPASRPSASIELSNGTTASNAVVQQWGWTGTAWQQWNITPAN